ncbi:TetR/AcrR family transcriptional regulator [Paenibacillus tianjinensis]|uniref:TetR/AcrR family transcriptional regulator n=1 Tax=Paenibacillus tianjinensis TaxID=2810347 RepID=A0ABX7L839_9BACL|nr:TetR/AcrR family transcriptional regulator [Paenibacillus tianjinensis]QSF42824.1 TetR/AcrR family transcriptional regulator [Paenibacillus tianjinensis]
MSVTKQDIIRSASRMFKEKGFLATSIQEIAQDCSIAKGSVYKYFPSKEDLMCAVFDECQTVYFERAEHLKQTGTGTPKEQLVNQIVFRFQYFIEYSHIMVDFIELPITQYATFRSLRNHVRARMMEWHRYWLLEVYGERIESFLWDLIFIYRAILKDYLQRIIFEVKQLSIEDTAWFIVDKMDALVEHMSRSGSKGLLGQIAFTKFIHADSKDWNNEKERIIGELFGRVTALLEAWPSGLARRRELQEIVQLLGTEISQTQPKRSLIQALCAYLEQEQELRSPVIQLKQLVLEE